MKGQARNVSIQALGSILSLTKFMYLLVIIAARTNKHYISFITPCKIATPKKSIEEAPAQLADPREWLQQCYIVTGFPLPVFSPR